MKKRFKKLKKYAIKPEIVILAGTDTQIEKFRIPEVKIRFNKGRLFDYGKITSSKDAYTILKKITGNMVQTQEMGTFLYLNRANKVLGFYKHTIGGTAGTIFDIKLIMSGAVKCLAHGIIASHNHPSGNLQPSDADKRLTKQLKSAAEVHDINLLDHIIVTKNGYTSFGDEGLLGLNGLQGNTTLKGTNMITKSNYFDEIKNIKISEFTPGMKESHDFMMENREFVGNDPDVDSLADYYIQNLNLWLGLHPEYAGKELKQKVERKSRTEKKARNKKVKPPRPPKAPRKKKEKPPKVKKVDDTPRVAHFDDDMKIIRRFAPMLGKTKPIRFVVNLYKTIQKAITEERVTKKNSTFHAMITELQGKLVSAINNAKSAKADFIRFEIKDTEFAERIKKIVKLEKVFDSVKLIKRYISLQGNETKEKAKKLHNEVSKALLNTPYIKYTEELTVVKRQLDDYIKGKDLEINPPVELHGLFGLIGQKKKHALNNLEGVINATDFEGMQFETLGITGKWKALLGDISLPFNMMSYGKPGHGKSTFNIMFAHYLASQFDKKILFVAKEEGTGFTLQDKFKRMKAFHSNISISSNLPANLNSYDFVFIDSVNEMGLEPDDLRKLQTKYPAISFIYIFKSTKDGKFRGSQDFEHMVDVSVRIEDGEARSEKSRFGGSGGFGIF